MTTRGQSFGLAGQGKVAMSHAPHRRSQVRFTPQPKTPSEKKNGSHYFCCNLLILLTKEWSAWRNSNSLPLAPHTSPHTHPAWGKQSAQARMNKLGRRRRPSVVRTGCAANNIASGKVARVFTFSRASRNEDRVFFGLVFKYCKNLLPWEEKSRKLMLTLQ